MSYFAVFTSYLPPFTSYLPIFASYLPPFLTNLPVSWPTSPLPYRTSLLSWECNTFFSLAHFFCFSATRIGASTRTRARTSRTQRVLNSCLHPSPLIIWKPEWCVWRFRPFLSSLDEQNLHFVFTINFLTISILSTSGEEVKEKNEKRRTRAHARASGIRMW